MALALVVGAVVAAVAPALYMYIVPVATARLPTLQNKRICLLIAHPDDEAMFFAPTVLALAGPDTGNHFKILCLSSGDADGLGETRKKELIKSGMKLGLRQEQDVFVIDSPDFKDSMANVWDKDKIATLLTRAFAPHHARQRAAGEELTANIDILVTFDASGVSGHPNHISLYHGARTFLDALSIDPNVRSPVDMYTLTSVSFLRKYTTIFDTVPTLLSYAASGDSNPPKPPPPPKIPRPKKEREGSDSDDDDDEEEEAAAAPHPGALVFFNQLSSSRGLGTAWSAMTTAHRSQMVWFRYGWIAFSRYMVVNDLRLEHIPAALPAAQSS